MERQHQAARQNFRGEFPTCWFCQRRPTRDTHEIAGGPARKEAYGVRCCWGAACGICNCDELTDKAKWPIARQLAVKFLMDRAHFDLRKFNHIRRGQEQIAWTDVVVWICKELDKCRIR